MRLTEDQQTVIRSASVETFGEGVVLAVWITGG